MNRKTKIVLISTLMLVEVITLFLLFKSSSNNIIKLDNVSLQEKNSEKKLFAVMLEQTDGTYLENDSFPTGDYFYDSSKSGCMDINGDKIDGVLTYDETTNTATVDTGKTSYCYLYFNSMNLYDLCEDYSNLSECMATEYDRDLTKIAYLSTNELGKMHRYQGDRDELHNNYICFGTKDKNECVSNTNKYMYRIIGIQSDGKMKLIKKEALNDQYKWSTNYGTVLWTDSDIYKGLNAIEGGLLGNIFVNSSEFDYMSTSGEWYSKINLYSWKYGSGVKINQSNGDTTFNNEDALENVVEAKIGLMYAHDFVYSFSNSVRNWMIIGANDSRVTVDSTKWYELTMSYSTDNPWYIVSHSGYINNAGYQGSPLVVRPVFYMNSDLSITGGTGKIDNPYIIS